MEALPDGPGGPESRDTSPSQKQQPQPPPADGPQQPPPPQQQQQQQELSLLRSALHSVTNGGGGGAAAAAAAVAEGAAAPPAGPPPMPPPPRQPDAGDDADAFFEYDLEESGAAAAPAAGGSGSGTGGADTGCAVTSPAEGSLSTSPPPPPPPPPPQPSQCPPSPAADVRPPPAAEPIPIPAASSTATYGRRQSSEGTFRTAAAELSAVHSAPVSPHVQQSPNERVELWLRVCASDSNTTADVEEHFGTPEAHLEPQFDIDLDSTVEEDPGATAEGATQIEGQVEEEVADEDDELAEVERFMSLQSIANVEPTSENSVDPRVSAVGDRLAHARDSIMVYREHHEHDHEHSDAADASGDAGGAAAPAAGAVEVVDVMEAARAVTPPRAATPPREREGGAEGEGEVEVVDVVGMVPREHGPGAEGGAAADEDAGQDADGSASAHSSSDAVPPDALKRSCSLKSGKTPPTTPSRKKFVRFADAMGLDLQRVHMFRDEIPNVPAAAFRGLNMANTSESAVAMPPTFQMSFSSTSLSTTPVSAASAAATAGVAAATAALDGPHLVPMFLQPGGSRNFTDQLHQNRVRLETIVCRDGEWAVRGVVRVLNMDFNKSVRVRYTTDNWATHREVEATYVQGSCDGLSDRFSFRLDAHGLPPGGQLQFAISFHCRGETFWDSNDGQNYTVQLHDVGPSLPSMAYSPPSDWAGGRY